MSCPNALIVGKVSHKVTEVQPLCDTSFGLSFKDIPENPTRAIS